LRPQRPLDGEHNIYSQYTLQAPPCYMDTSVEKGITFADQDSEQFRNYENSGRGQNTSETGRTFLALTQPQTSRAGKRQGMCQGERLRATAASFAARFAASSTAIFCSLVTEKFAGQSWPFAADFMPPPQASQKDSRPDCGRRGRTSSVSIQPSNRVGEEST
jgi:hypothetical protein